MTDPADLTLVELLPLLRSRTLSARELLTACLSRVERWEPEVKAFVTLTPELASRAAEAADAARAAGRPVGPLAGVPVALKDLYCTTGVPTTASSRVLAGYDPGVDAEVWVRLRDAGAGLLGKTTLHEFAYGTGSFPTRNPWDLARTPGGSSGGSAAALAARMVPVAMGTDTGGSLRIPAAACGLSSLRPTSGRLSAYGVLPLSHSLDAVGPMARRMLDTALLLALLAGHDRRDPHSLDESVPAYPTAARDDLRGMRIGLPTSYFWDDVDLQIADGCLGGLDRLVDRGAELVPVEPPPETPRILAVPGTYGVTMGIEALEHHAGWLAEGEELYTDGVRRRFAEARQVTREQYVEAQQDRLRWADDWRRIVERAGLAAVASPTIPQPPGRVGPDGRGPGPTIGLAKAWSVARFPSLSVPTGLDARGLPVGLSLSALPEQEAALVGLGITLDEDVQLWRRSPLPGPG
ncbi:MAG: glutamyl-tRNA(Gln) amidotransferase subunit [Frankiales bacterium]|jgi:aspartyl-tRNA(Asn)/glutamyl-tRNA(Gln) amidotransferase subunit A|nr:glutamyl-tRNA(Gln) amidotransferase subunit [Frankiales bacterium]